MFWPSFTPEGVLLFFFFTPNPNPSCFISLTFSVWLGQQEVPCSVSPAFLEAFNSSLHPERSHLPLASGSAALQEPLGPSSDQLVSGRPWEPPGLHDAHVDPTCTFPMVCRATGTSGPPQLGGVSDLQQEAPLVPRISPRPAAPTACRQPHEIKGRSVVLRIAG